MPFSKTEVNRAGERLAALNREADSSGFRFTPDWIDHFTAALDVVDWWRSEHAAALTRVAANLRYYAAEVEQPPVVAQRLKRLPTIADKLAREEKTKLARMGDIGGVRAVLPNQAAAYHVARRLRKNWTITRFSDYVAEPKPDGYRALHLINRHRGRLIEVQLRTPLQDEWANLVEFLSRTVAGGLKFGEGPPELRRLLADLAATDFRIEIGSAEVDELKAKLREIQTWSLAFVGDRK
jgi:putative GTP pyrophosphokinase